MIGGFFVGQGVFCLDVKFFTPRIFFRSRIRNFTSRIFFFLDVAFGHVKDFPSLFFLTPRNPKDFFSLDAYPKEAQGFRVKMFLRQGFFENWWKWFSNSKKAPCINETNYITTEQSVTSITVVCLVPANITIFCTKIFTFFFKKRAMTNGIYRQWPMCIDIYYIHLTQVFIK